MGSGGYAAIDRIYASGLEARFLAEEIGDEIGDFVGCRFAWIGR
jgi:hypothetical protein